MMSSRCFLSRSLLAFEDSGDDPSEERLGDADPDGELSPLIGKLDTK